MKKTKQQNLNHPTLEYLGNIIGSLRYFGACSCGEQFMSTWDRAMCIDTHIILCEKCAYNHVNAGLIG